MDFFNVINVALPVIYVLVGIVLVWFVIELVMTVRKTRETVTSVQKQLEPTLEHVEKITASLEPRVRQDRSPGRSRVPHGRRREFGGHGASIRFSRTWGKSPARHRVP